MTEQHIERIARGLSKAQREDVVTADANDPFCTHFSRLYFSDSSHALVDAYPAHDDPDHLPDEDGGTRWSWTETGLKVRAYLQERGE